MSCPVKTASSANHRHGPCCKENHSRAYTDTWCGQVKADARASQQFLLLSHLYSQKADAAALAKLRKELLRPKYTAMELALGSIVGVSAVGGTTNCSTTLSSCLCRRLHCIVKCQSAWHSLCRLPDIFELLSSRGTEQMIGETHHSCP